MYIYTYICTCTYVHVYMHVCIYINTHKYHTDDTYMCIYLKNTCGFE